jgi:hypothetical protein
VGVVTVWMSANIDTDLSLVSSEPRQDCLEGRDVRFTDMVSI